MGTGAREVVLAGAPRRLCSGGRGFPGSAAAVLTLGPDERARVRAIAGNLLEDRAMTTWVLLAAAIAAEATGSLALKAALGNPAWYAVVGAGYTAAFVLLAAVLRRGLPLGVAYGVWAAMGVTLTALGAAVLFGEVLTPLMLAGIALVVAGVRCVELGSHRAPPAGGLLMAWLFLVGSIVTEVTATLSLRVAAGVALTAVAGRVLFREPVTWPMALGVALIMGGVLLIEVGAPH